MPYDAAGRGITAEELKKEQEYLEKHPKRIAVANATLPALAGFFFLAGVVGVGAKLISLIATGETANIALGVGGIGAILGLTVFGFVESRIDI